ncbi:STAS domain-containing protein [Olsenella uli]
MALSITTTGPASERLVTVTGEVDVSNAAELRSELDTALATGASTVRVDLEGVPYIDSTGIGVLVGAAHRADEAGADLAVLNPQRNVARVLDMLGVSGELGIGD